MQHPMSRVGVRSSVILRLANSQDVRDDRGPYEVKWNCKVVKSEAGHTVAKYKSRRSTPFKLASLFPQLSYTYQKFARLLNCLISHQSNQNRPTPQ
jgi:hypothetical protein